MKILVQGDKKKLKGIKTFNCIVCGCIFEADNTEYKLSSQYNESYYYINCPFCGKFVTKKED